MDILDDDGLLDLRGRARRTDPAAVTAEERAQRRRELGDSNDALRAWQQERPGSTTTDTPAEGPVDATCRICKARAARHRCTQCGQAACAGDFWVMFGLCVRCATQERIERWHGTAAPEPDNWLERDGP